MALEQDQSLFPPHTDDDFDCQFCNQSYWQISTDDWIVKPRWEVAVKVTGVHIQYS